MDEDREEVQRILELLRTLIRILGLPNREIERRLGLTPSYLSRLFGGYIEVKLEHVVSIARALGLKPGEFFEFAYPERVDPPSESAKKIRTVLHSMQPSRSGEPAPPPKPPGLSPEEVERKIQDALQQVLRDLRNSAG